ncbi:hypothetical protein N7520_003661 [Penicillium odoratum]|uniref:uncharacterized protein n=1 Tax=Penicillium odoratum TaxID=1167516 RepID=UPI002548F346|nr:uncharacterized protein N7520_003661 [Penicillium odoratum]KAJ5769102.1 hypothetical protein N7520_003661 [Penicillium odoratum]
MLCPKLHEINGIRSADQPPADLSGTNFDSLNDMAKHYEMSTKPTAEEGRAHDPITPTWHLPHVSLAHAVMDKTN